MDSEKNFLIGNYVKGKRTSNGEVIEGKFNGFRLYNKLNPKSVVGVIDTDERCYDVSVDSIELVESKDEKVRKAILGLVKQSSHILNPMNQKSMIAWLEKQGEQKPWSEEDEKIMKRVDSLLYSLCQIHGSEYEELHNWLKSLKPNHWKPSEQNIKDLELLS